MQKADDRDVLSLVVLDGATEDSLVTEDLRILVSVRDPINNRTHPGVVSVPTIRIPTALAADLRQGQHVHSQFGSTELFDCATVNSLDAGGHSPVIFAVKATLCQKLGVAEALESGGLHFRAAIAASTSGWSYYDNEPSPTAEFIRMTTLLVFITKGVNTFSSQTSSYSSVMWCEVGKFLGAAQARDVSALDYDPVSICIHGMCIASAYDILASKLGGAPYLRGAIVDPAAWTNSRARRRASKTSSDTEFSTRE